MYLKNMLMLCWLCYLPLQSIFAQTSDLYSNVSTISRQCMLTQRAVKSYLALHYLKDANQELFLKGSIESFDLVHDEILKKNTNEVIREKIEHLYILWESYKFFIEEEYNAENAEATLKMSNKIMNVCIDLVNLCEPEIEKQKGKRNTAFHAISLSASLSAFFNKSAVHILSYMNGVGIEEVNKKQWVDLRNFIETVFKDLATFKNSTAELDAKLLETNNLWIDFEKKANKLLDAKSKDLTALKNLLIDVDYLSKSSDELANMYELAASQLIEGGK